MNPEDDVIITNAEWEAAMVAARIFRDTARSFRANNADGLAAECDRHAGALEGLGRRATVAAAPDIQPDLRVVRAELEAER